MASLPSSITPSRRRLPMPLESKEIYLPRRLLIRMWSNRRLAAFVLCGITALAHHRVHAEPQFYLRLENTGQEYGPFELREGAPVHLGRAIFTVVPVPSPAAPVTPEAGPVERRDITGYDGIRFGDSVDDVLRALLWLPGVEKDDLGAPMLRKARGEPHHQYRVVRSPDDAESRSEVLVIFDPAGVEMLQDTFSGEWMWDRAAARREFDRKKQALEELWGRPTESLRDYVEWIRPSGLGALRLDEPERPGELPVLKLGIRRK